MAKISSVFNKPADCRVHKPCAAWVLPSQLIGLEFEAENVSYAREGFPADNLLRRHYHMKGDGSLRDNGAEFVFANPLMGQDMDDALVIMSKESKNWSLSERCGLHVHLDVRDMEQIDIYKLFLLYATFEYLIYQFVGDNRDKNNFCVPWFRTYEQHGVMSKILNGKNYDEVGMYVENASRYMGMNLASLSKFGTLEFRHMQNTHDFTKITNWINIIMQLKKSAEEEPLTGEDLLQKIHRTQPEKFAEEKMPLLFSIVGRLPGFVQLFNQGVEVCEEILISAAPKDYFNINMSTLTGKHKGNAEGLNRFIAKRPLVTV